MKNQEFKRITDIQLVMMVRDNPFIRVNHLATKAKIPYRTIRGKVERLRKEGRLVGQKRGDHIHLVTTHYAKKHNVKEVYVKVEEKSVKDLQKLFNQLSFNRGLAL